jgi:hypothetical protein
VAIEEYERLAEQALRSGKSNQKPTRKEQEG